MIDSCKYVFPLGSFMMIVLTVIKTLLRIKREDDDNQYRRNADGDGDDVEIVSFKRRRMTPKETDIVVDLTG